MKITNLRHGANINTIHDNTRAELDALMPKIEKAIENVEFHRQYGDNNLLAMWVDELNHLCKQAEELLQRLQK